MLCSSKTLHRPDKLLQKRLVALAYSLTLLIAALLMLFANPQQIILWIIATVILASLCLIQRIKTLNAAEKAITYGGFANEIIKSDFLGERIDNALGEAVLQNMPAEELFKGRPVLEFLESHLSDNTFNKANFFRLQNACNNLSAAQITLSLVLHQEDNRIFGDEEWFKITVRPIFLRKTDIFNGPFSIKSIKKETYLYWNIQNTTAEKNMERVFQSECRSLHDFLDYLPVGLYITDKDYNIEYANDNFAKMLGMAHQDLIGRNLSDFLTTNSDLPARSFLWKGELHFKNQKNQICESFVFQETFSEQRKIKNRGVVVSQLPGEPELKSRLNEAFDRISWLFNFAPVGILFLDNKGIIQEANARAAEFLGCAKKELLQAPVFDYLKADNAEQAKIQINNLLSCRSTSENMDVHIQTQGQEKTALAYLSPMKKFYAADISQIDGLVVYLIDATKQKNLELQFAQAQKMQAVGQLAGGVAHDFNNLLTAMIGFCDLLLQRHGVGDPSFSDLIQIKQNANRAAGLVRQLLAFSRKQPLKPKLIDTTENFMELTQMLKRILGERIVLRFHHGSDLGFIKVDPVQFSQVIINLAVNAKDAMEGSGTLTISTRTETLSEPYHFGDDIIKPGEFVVISVTDTGCGIPPENLNRIFDPFFSTKQNVVGSGTGLGLAMVYGIVRQTEGFIKVESKIGSGTTFSIYLPRFEYAPEVSTGEKKEIMTPDGTPVLAIQEKVSPAVPLNDKLIVGLNLSALDHMEAPLKTAGETRILFVEDEDSVRTFGLRALKKKGYEVVGCNSGENALEHLETDTNFDLLITDMVMPGMTGAQLTIKTREKIPGIKVILASGYSEEIVRQELPDFHDFEFITKPYSLGDLTARVFDVLNNQPEQKEKK